MADSGTALLRQHLSALPEPRPRRRRPLLSRFSAAHGAMVLSGLVTFVLIASVMDNRSASLTVAVAKTDIGAGTVVTAEMAGSEQLAADSELAPKLVPMARLGQGRWFATRAIPAGEAIRGGDLTRDDPTAGMRSMSIPVDRENAVGGAISVGDRVDVIDLVDGRAVFVVANAQVLKVSSSDQSGGLARESSRGFFVVVQVNAGEALSIAQALSDGKVDLVRSSGVTPTLTPALGASATGGAAGVRR